MLQSQVINKLAKECCLAMGDFDKYKTVKIYIQMALVVGIEHFTIKMEEIVVMTKEGVEIGRFKSITETADKLGLKEENISATLNGRQCSCGGMLFMKARDHDLIPREEKSPSISLNEL